MCQLWTASLLNFPRAGPAGKVSIAEMRQQVRAKQLLEALGRRGHRRQERQRGHQAGYTHRKLAHYRRFHVRNNFNTFIRQS